MTLATNGFDGITPSGTAITTANSGGTSGNAFDSVTGAPLSDSGTIHGSSGLAMRVNSAAAAQYAAWTQATFTSVPGALHFRVYLKMPSLLAATVQLVTLRTATATCGFVNVTTTGTLQLRNSASATLWTSTALATGAWHRIEGLVLGGTTGSDGQAQVQVFSGANSEGSTPDQDSTLFTGANCGTTGTANNLRIGSATVVTVTFSVDDIGGSTTGALGPSVTGTNASAGLAAATGVPPGQAASAALNMTIQGA